MSFLRSIPPIDISDQDLVIRYKNEGDLQVLAQLYGRYMELVYGVCQKYLKDSELSKDAVMNIFEELVKKLRTHDVDNFRSWLYVLARNHCLMQLRTPRNLKTIELNPAIMQSEENVHLNGVMEKEESLKLMEECLETLPAEQKQSLELFYLQNKCYNEISELTGLDWNKVRSHIQNGRRNMKICMEKTTDDKRFTTDD
jgi:RNA polymerase sigma factor (sigma-70 family)